ncbi:hypothetical protein GF324_03615, partial [bacterium]|nr:hypothetical protein [bacterium]
MSEDNGSKKRQTYGPHDEERARWEAETYLPKGRYRKDNINFTTVSSAEVPHIVGPEYF